MLTETHGFTHWTDRSSNHRNIKIQDLLGHKELRNFLILHFQRFKDLNSSKSYVKIKFFPGYKEKPVSVVEPHCP
jgi:hypothetical protein